MNKTEREIFAKGVQYGVELSVAHCRSNAAEHSSHDRPWEADALKDEADHMTEYNEHYVRNIGWTAERERWERMADDLGIPLP